MFSAGCRKTFLVCWLVAELTGIPGRAAELKPETAASFDRYIRAVEARMDDDVRHNQFLIVDRLPDLRRREAYDQLQQGQIYIEDLDIREDDRPVPIPGGLIHHWAGVIFIPKATLFEVIAVLQDYENHQNIYKPEVRRSKLIEHSGNESKIYLQLFNKSIVTVVLNAHFDVSDTQFGSTRRQIASRSTRIAELANPGRPNEHELPVGNDHGYTWRLNSYWRVEEKDGGAYVQEESVALSRTVPAIFAWLVNPFLNNIPRGILFHLLTNTRNAVMKAGTSSEQDRASRKGCSSHSGRLQREGASSVAIQIAAVPANGLLRRAMTHRSLVQNTWTPAPWE